jgi:hypothetical protein
MTMDALFFPVSADEWGMDGGFVGWLAGCLSLEWHGHFAGHINSVMLMTYNCRMMMMMMMSFFGHGLVAALRCEPILMLLVQVLRTLDGEMHGIRWGMDILPAISMHHDESYNKSLDDAETFSETDGWPRGAASRKPILMWLAYVTL